MTPIVFVQNQISQRAAGQPVTPLTATSEPSDTVEPRFPPAAPQGDPRGLTRSAIPKSLPYQVVSATTGAIRPEAGHDPDALRNLLASRGITLYSIRHGQTVANAAGPSFNQVLAGQVETPLTPTGKQEAQQAAVQLYQDLGGDAWLQQVAAHPNKLPVIYAGPLSRAQETAQATVSYLVQQADRLALQGAITPQQHEAIVNGLQIKTDPRITEIGFGQFEMHHALDLLVHHPEFAIDYAASGGKGVDFLHRFPGGESRVDVLNRTNAFLHDVADHDAGRTVLMFSHNETIDCAQVLLNENRVAKDGAVRASLIGNATPQRLI